MIGLQNCNYWKFLIRGVLGRRWEEMGGGGGGCGGLFVLDYKILFSGDSCRKHPIG